MWSLLRTTICQTSSVTSRVFIRTYFREEDTSAGFHAGPLFSSNWNLEMLVFVEGGNPAGNTVDEPLEHGQNKRQTQPTYRTRVEQSNPGNIGGYSHHIIPAPQLKKNHQLT